MAQVENLRQQREEAIVQLYDMIVMAQVANLRQQKVTLWHKLQTCASDGKTCASNGTI